MGWKGVGVLILGGGEEEGWRLDFWRVNLWGRVIFLLMVRKEGNALCLDILVAVVRIFTTNTLLSIMLVSFTTKNSI